ncbi:maleylpyruvate isomerase family mycothiol-dependent enzyme [Micromonospora sp. DT31]|uniref:maleylpyruvate isomerase family mycothiol-dependent enzyme n=1 Tax=Micromonospora sp. DT31 TaxID=3393434 RepID=UPI003CF5872B
MPDTLTRGDLWALAHAERAALADDLAGLDTAGWARRSLCGRWTVREVVAHLTAAATVGRTRWLVSVLGARFDFARHNDRRLAEHRGADPGETLDRFRRIIGSTTSTFGPTQAWLGEVIVHAQDIRRPLGLGRTPPVGAPSRRSPGSTPAGTSRWPGAARSTAFGWRRPTGRSPPVPVRWSAAPRWR